MKENNFTIKLSVSTSTHTSKIIYSKDEKKVTVLLHIKEEGDKFLIDIFVKHIITIYLSFILKNSKIRKSLMEKYFPDCKYDQSIIVNLQSLCVGYLYNNNSCAFDCVLLFVHLFAPNLLEKVEILRENHIKLLNNIRTTSASFREKLYLRDSSLKSRNNKFWEPQSVSTVYNLLCEEIPQLCMSIPFLLKKSRKIKVEKIPLLTMWDFIEFSNDKKGILWNRILCDFLVFYNSGTPRLKHLNSLKPEKSINTIDNTVYTSIPQKKACFDKFILNRQYICVYVIILQNISPTGEGGSHYFSYFLNEDENKWYMYNDISPTFIKLDKIPDDIWREENFNMPAMYFFKRM
jgi:hypothetical protein